MRFEDFRERVINEVKVMGSQNKVAQYYGVNQGLISRVINHHDESPTLRKAMNIPRWPKRIRWIVDTDQYTFDRLTEIARSENKTRSELLESMIDVYSLKYLRVKNA